VSAEVIENIRTRAAQRGAGMLTPSGLKVALVIQGGTLRSVASCGAAAALDRLGLTNAFDMVYGASSGAVNGAYFLAGQAALGLTVYLEDVNNRRFLNLLRYRKMLDLEYFFDEIVRGRKKHDIAAFQRQPTELRVLTTCLEDMKTVWFSSKDHGVDLYDVLKASCALPLIYGRGVRIGNKHYVDGVVTEPIPIITPLQEDYTDILVLLTRHTSSRSTEDDGFLSRCVTGPLMKRELGAELFQSYRDRWHRYNDAMDIIESGTFKQASGRTVRLCYVCPDRDAEAHKFEMRRDRLAFAGYSSWRNTLELFGVTSANSQADFERMLLEAKQQHRDGVA